MTVAEGLSITFVETPSQAETVRACGLPVTIIATSPIVDYWAEKVSSQVIGIEELFDERAHRDLGAAVIDRTEALVAAIDVVLHRVAPKWPFADVVSFGAFFHYANGTLDAIVLRLEQILGACDVLGATSLVGFRTRRDYQFTGITSLDHAPWGLITQLAPMVAAARSLEVRWIDAPDADPSLFNPVRDAPPSATVPITSSSSPIRARAQQLHAWIRSVVCRLAEVPATGRESPRHSPGGGPLLISSLFSDLGDDVVESWARRGGHVMDMNQAFSLAGTEDTGSQAAVSCKLLWEKLTQEPRVRELLVWKGIDLWPLFAPWLQRVIREALPPLFRRAEAVWNRLMTERDFGNAAFVAGGWVTDHYVVARIAQRVGLPTVSYHYGGFLGFSLLPKHERFDFAECDYFLCGGVGAERTFEHPAPQTHWNPAVRRAQPIATGVPWVVELLASRRTTLLTRSPCRRRIMFVLNALLGDCRDLGFQFTPEIQYWRFTRKVVERMRECDDIEIIIKPPLRNRYPQMPNPLLDWIRDIDLNKIKVVNDVPLKDCLNLADAYIIESPSTPLQQVVATNKPILLYINRGDYLLESDAAAALRDRAAVFAQTEFEFLSGLDRFLKKPDWSCDSVDDRFLHDYVIGGPEAMPTDRIVDFLHTVIAQRPNASCPTMATK
jgi:hypothetical protein